MLIRDADVSFLARLNGVGARGILLTLDSTVAGGDVPSVRFWNSASDPISAIVGVQLDDSPSSPVGYPVRVGARPGAIYPLYINSGQALTPGTPIAPSTSGTSIIKTAGNAPTIAISVTTQLSTTEPIANCIWIGPSLGGVAAPAGLTWEVVIGLASELTINAASMFPTTNLGLTNGGGAIYWDGTFSRKYYDRQTGTTTVAAGAGAGTTPTVTLAAGSTDQKGYLLVTTGTVPTAAATIATVTFSQAWAATPSGLVLTPVNAAAAALSGTSKPYASRTGLTTGVFTVTAGAAALAASTAYEWAYQVMG